MKVAVDLTLAMQGGDNGGVKIMVVELISQLAKIAPQHQFILLVPHRCYEELSYLDAENVIRLCVDLKSNTHVKTSYFVKIMRFFVKNKITRKFFTCFKFLLLYGKARRPIKENNLLRKIGADLLFCPFTAQRFFDPKVPIVSVICDLQYYDYPNFFSKEDYLYREQQFIEACRLSSHIICISNFTRDTVIKHSNLSSDCVSTIYIRMPHRLQQNNLSNFADDVLQRRFALIKNNYLLYPANFWLHKNHEILFTAFNMYLKQNPTSTLKLVCTGSIKDRMNELSTAVRLMGLEDRIILFGYVTNEEFASILSACKALIFPSLYEGFGMPVLEAMFIGKPVLCSNTASLPEIAGKAALFFDPKKPDSIAAAIKRIEVDSKLVRDLVKLGYAQAKNFVDTQFMAQQYLAIFAQVIASFRLDQQSTDVIHGVYFDGWSSDRINICFHGGRKRYLKISANLPAWLPIKKMKVCFTINDDKTIQYIIKTGEMLNIKQLLPTKGGHVNILLNPCFCPKHIGLGDDERKLGIVLHECKLVSASEEKSLL
jgi:glycosyltransferase involved in cell wall biosynthesis